MGLLHETDCCGCTPPVLFALAAAVVANPTNPYQQPAHD